MVGPRERLPEIPSAGLAGELLIGFLGGIAPGERREFTDSSEAKQLTDLLLSLPEADEQIYRASGGERKPRNPGERVEYSGGFAYCGDCGGKRDLYWVGFRNSQNYPSFQRTDSLIVCPPCRRILFLITSSSREELKGVIKERGVLVKGIYHVSSEDLETLKELSPLQSHP